MLTVAILLGVACPTVLRKYDLRKHVHIFKARSQTSVNKYNSTCWMGYCGMRYALIPIETDMTKKILLGRRYDHHLFIYSWFVRMTIKWVIFSLMYRQRINTNISHLSFFSCRILIISYKMLIITGIPNETRNELTIYTILSRNVTIF